MRIKTSRTVDMDSTMESNELEEETRIFLEATGGKNKKGRFYGLGSETPTVTPYSYRTFPQSNTVHEVDIQNVVIQLQEENENLRRQNETISSRMDALEQKLSGDVNNSDIETNEDTS